jgi:hypothetical protein
VQNASASHRLASREARGSRPEKQVVIAARMMAVDEHEVAQNQGYLSPTPGANMEELKEIIGWIEEARRTLRELTGESPPLTRCAETRPSGHRPRAKLSRNSACSALTAVVRTIALSLPEVGHCATALPTSRRSEQPSSDRTSSSIAAFCGSPRASALYAAAVFFRVPGE